MKMTNKSVNHNVGVFFDKYEYYTNLEYVRTKIEKALRAYDPCVADLYMNETKQSDLSDVIRRASYVFDVDVYFEAGSLEWIAATNELYEEWLNVEEETTEGDDKPFKPEEDTFMGTWPDTYQALKASWVSKHSFSNEEGGN